MSKFGKRAQRGKIQKFSHSVEKSEIRFHQKYFVKSTFVHSRIFVKEVRYTVWKFQFHEFSVNSILRESNLGEFKSSKTAVFVVLGAMHFVTFGIF